MIHIDSDNRPTIKTNSKTLTDLITLKNFHIKLLNRDVVKLLQNSIDNFTNIILLTDSEKHPTVSYDDLIDCKTMLERTIEPLINLYSELYKMEHKK